MEDAWKQIVSEALAAGLNHSDGPVPGARLRQLIAKSAQKFGLEYPPTEYPEESFGDFLKRFDSIVMIRRRKGKDLLVAPVDNPQLLVETPKDDTARIREDLFEAFTRIPRGVPPSEPWYRRTSDTVVWRALIALRAPSRPAGKPHYLPRTLVITLGGEDHHANRPLYCGAESPLIRSATLFASTASSTT